MVAFPSYTAVSVAGLGYLPDTITTRSVIIRMRRRARNEKAEPFRARLHEAEGHKLRDRLAQWADQVRDDIAGRWPEMPEGVTDRPADVWEPLLSVVDAVGGDWRRADRGQEPHARGQASDPVRGPSEAERSQCRGCGRLADGTGRRAGYQNAHLRWQKQERAPHGIEWSPAGRVFTTTSGEPRNAANVRRDFRAIVRKAGLEPEWKPRELRHSFVSLLSDHGIPLERIACWSGTAARPRQRRLPQATSARDHAGADAMDEIFVRA